MIELALFAGIVVVVLIVGVGIGMLMAGRLTRWMDRADEEPDDR
jgi:ABC-type dipeptide/oligopeptide/nickel transport system permease component